MTSLALCLDHEQLESIRIALSGPTRPVLFIFLKPPAAEADRTPGALGPGGLELEDERWDGLS
jgi:hypothetical protein